ncbi:MAG: hypothetical protein HUK04_00420 [Bacteroidaceae bacterium]|nr:hypothetical protein [Bacteroidaceae bacterium]
MEKRQEIESRVADTILQAPEAIKVGETTYTVAPPSAATIILVSEAVARLPLVRFNGKRVLEDSLRYGRECKALGEIGAILILGAKHINDREENNVTTTRKRRLFGLLPDKVEQWTSRGRLKKDIIVKQLMEDMTPRELAATIGTLLGKIQVSDFFELTTFLTEINLIRPTKVETEPTAYGR